MIKFSEIKIFVGAVNVPSLGQWFTLPVSPPPPRWQGSGPREPMAHNSSHEGEQMSEHPASLAM